MHSDARGSAFGVQAPDPWEGSGGRAPARGLPSHATCVYVRDLAAMVLIVLAFPFLARALIKRPASVVKAVAR